MPGLVYDLFPFFNELDILKLRLNILNPYVDRFVIEEATVTFSGAPKELCFEKNRHIFSEFLPKIEYIVVADSPAEMTTHERDNFQKNHLLQGLHDATENDIIILSDVDEIPNPQVLVEIIANFDPTMVYHLAQRMFYGYLNLEEISGKLLSITGEFAGIATPQWLGTKIFAKGSIPQSGIIDLRMADVNAPNSRRISNGGWHFGYMGGAGERDLGKRIGVKVQAAAHQEYNNRDTLAEAADKLLLGQDIFGREAQFVRVEIDESYPEYLRQHLSEYEHLILPRLEPSQLKRKSVAMKAKRFCRKAMRKVKRWFKRSET
jgi:beta-1,4-mannosyl-glycoprotein beta-1,4-N-acetylglucosaminyltransferase